MSATIERSTMTDCRVQAGRLDVEHVRVDFPILRQTVNPSIPGMCQSSNTIFGLCSWNIFQPVLPSSACRILNPH